MRGVILDELTPVSDSEVIRKPRRRTKNPTTDYRAHGAKVKKRIVAIDGEGWGEDEYGRQIYRLMCAADNHGNRWTLTEKAKGWGLRTEEIFLWFRDELPHDGLFTSYYFGYDVAHILVDWNLDKLRELYDRTTRQNITEDNPFKAQVEWNGWRIDWFPHKRFSVRSYGVRTIIWDAGPYFQKAFVTALKDSGLFTDDLIAFIQKGKERRGDDEHIIADEIAYCIAECEALAKLLDNLITTAADLDIHQTDYWGPASIAKVLLRKHRVNQYKNTDETTEIISERAYVGGRFEQTGHGKQPLLYEYDINSAYPAALVNLPCFAHGQWKYIKANPNPDNPYSDISLVHVTWGRDHSFTDTWGPFPVRQSSGIPHWPFEGHAWVWRWEVEAANKIPGLWIEELESWEWIRECDHQPFAYIADLYLERKKYKDGREKIVKLALNSTYGKLAQTKGNNPPFKSISWAGMITSHTRAQLLEAIALDPDAVIATATDAILSTKPLSLDIGDKLGQWSEPTELYDCLLVQPGFYNARRTNSPKYPNGKSRTRGIPARLIDWSNYWKLFDTLPDLDYYNLSKDELDKQTCVPLTHTQHIGIGLTVHSGKIERLGRWEDITHNIRFHSKKRPDHQWSSRDWFKSYPISEDFNLADELVRYDPKIWDENGIEELKAGEFDADDWSYETFD